MAYFGYVTTLENVLKDPKSDNLYTATCMSEGVIVGGGSQNGDKVLYLPADGQVAHWFGDELQLFRKNLDGTSQGGYLDEKGHIKALKLRGLRSEGIAIPWAKVVDKHPALNIYEVGDKFNEIKGIEAFKKYIPRQRHAPNGASKTTYKGRKAEGIIYPEFAMHSDTAQLAYNQQAFREGDEISISLKMHGCFISGTKVRTPDGLKEIQKIKVGDEVLALNHKTGKIEVTKVLQIFHNQPSNRWRKIKVSRDYLKGDKRGYITCTPNHPFWSEEKRAYINAESLEVGETIHSLFPSIVLTQLQKDVAIGMMLGDGCLQAFGGRACEIQGGSKKEHEAYQDFLAELLSGWYYKVDREYVSGYGTTMVRGRTTRCADLYNYLEDCTYFSNQADKKLKEGIIDKFTPLAAAILYMEDGSLAHSKAQQDRATIAICDYGEEDAEIIRRCFVKFDIHPVVYQDNRGYHRLRFNLADANKLWDLIEGYIPEVMQYKLPKERRGKQINITDPEHHYEGFVLSPQTVLVNEPLEETHFEYDLETELHNYIVGLNIVHNTSQRSMNTIAEYPRNWFRKLFRMKPKQKPVYILGTRRCVVTENSTGYYGNDTFRMPHHKKIEKHVSPGMEIFYEVVGYYNEDATIMPSADNKKLNDKKFVKRFGPTTDFTYGCEPGQSEMYVYRITAHNGELEYSPEDIKAWCEAAGVPHVPFLEKFIFTTWEDLLDRVNAHFEDLTDPIGKTHLKEGVVVRILNRKNFAAFKSKTYEFKVLEGIIKETATKADMEESEELADE